MVLPVADGIVTQIFGPTAEPLDSGGVNKGIDIAGPVGTTIIAPVSGIVVQAGEGSDGWGIAVKIRDDEGYIHNLGHLSAVAGIKVGQRVEEGSVVGKMGSTGASTGSHLSWDIRGPNGYVDPSRWAGFQASGDNRTWQPQRLTAIAGGSGATTMAGRFYEDPAMDREYEELRQARQAAYDAWVRAGRPSDGDEYYAYADAQTFLDEWVQSHETFRVPYEDPSNAAQDAFDNSIRLGDFNLREADSAFNRWLQSTGEARAAATTELEARRAHNADLAGMVEARATSPAAGLLPRPTDAGYVEQSFDQLYNKYRDRFGAQGAFDPDNVPSAGVTLPSTSAPSTPGATPISPDYPRGAAGSIWDQAKSKSMEQSLSGPQSAALYSSANQAMRQADGTMAPGPGAPAWQKWADRLGTQVAAQAGPVGSMAYGAGRLVASPAMSGAKKAKDALMQPWWKRAFAKGGVNLPGGPALVGERPEIVEAPGFGARVVNEPTEMNLPEGANVIPIDELMALQQIRTAAQQPAANPTTSPEAQAQRANDPQLQQKVMASIQRAMASNMAANPPFTPVLGDPRIKDYWAPYRKITGVAPFPQAPTEAAQ